MTSSPETAARLGDGLSQPVPAGGGRRWPLWLRPGLLGAALGGLIVGLVWWL